MQKSSLRLVILFLSSVGLSSTWHLDCNDRFVSLYFSFKKRTSDYKLKRKQGLIAIRNNKQITCCGLLAFLYSYTNYFHHWQVTFHYIGYNESGRRIDSTYVQGSPAKIRMGTKALVPGDLML